MAVVIAPICLVLDEVEAQIIAEALEAARDAAPDEHAHSMEIALALRAVREAMADTGPSFDPTARHDGAEPAPPAFHPAARTGAIDDASTTRPEGAPSPPPLGSTAAARNTAAVPDLLAEREAHRATALGLGGLLAKAVAEADALQRRCEALRRQLDADERYFGTQAARDHAVVVLRRCIPGLTVAHATRMARALGIGPED